MWFWRDLSRAEFKLQILEVFRAAKQRQYLKMYKDKNATLDAEESEDATLDHNKIDHFVFYIQQV